MSSIILALDASSSAIGYAAMRPSGRYEDRVRSGVIRAPKAWPWSLRIRSMADQVSDVLAWALEHNVEAVLLEVPGTVQTMRKDGGRSGNMRYAMAVGAVLLRCWDLLPTTVPTITVEAELWTRLGGHHGVRKDRRVAQLEAVDASYNASADPGGDEADAIMLATWWITAYRLANAAGADAALQLPQVALPGNLDYATSNLVLSEGGRLSPRGKRSTM